MLMVVGEALIDIVVSRDGRSTEHVGGSPANVALALARLGNDVGLVTSVGRDDRGDRIVAHLAGNGVRLLGQVRGAAATSTATATLDEAGVATYDFALVWDVEDIELDDAVTCVHVGSLGVAIEPGASAVIEAVSRAADRVLVSFDPNPRPRLVSDHTAAVGRTEQVASLAHVVKTSDEDLDFLYPGQSLEQVARHWLEAERTALVVVTRGADGAVAVTRSQIVSIEAPATAVVDTVGAGDTFTAGLLDALARRQLLDVRRTGDLQDDDGQMLQAVLREAAMTASITCEREGADPPTRVEVVDRMRRPDRIGR